jgi:hypothetical protein
MNTLIANLLLNLVIFNVAYRWLLKPYLPKINPMFVLLPILLLHSMRHLGLMFVAPGVVVAGMPWQFAIPSAAGDFIAAVLAFTAAVLIHRKSTYAVPATWVFNVFGLLDFAMAIVLSRVFKNVDYLGAAYWIPAFWVPMLIVGHFIIFDVLRMLKRNGTSLKA